MYYELYIDVFFLENFMIDSLLLFAVGRLLRCSRSCGRVILGGAAGSFLTCLVIAVPFPTVLKLILFYVVVNSFMLTAGLKISGVRQFVLAFILLYLSAFVVGGVVQFFRPWLKYAGFIYAAFAAGYVLFLNLWRMVSAVRMRDEGIVEVTLYAGDAQKEIHALWDTGNVLSDPLTGDPVNILAPGLAEELISEEMCERGLRYIPFSSVGGESILQVFRGEKMCIHTEEECWISKPLLGISPRDFSAGCTYQMILNPGVLFR